MCFNKSSSSSEQKQETKQSEDTLTSIGSSGDVIRGENITISSAITPEEKDMFDSLISVIQDSVTGAGNVVEYAMAGQQSALNSIASLKSEQQAPENTTLKILAFASVAIAGVMMLPHILKGLK